MERYALLASLQARPGKEREAEDFLRSAEPLAKQEPGTIRWYAFKTGPAMFGIFDTFADEAGRDAHLNGEIAKALMARADELFAESPQIDKLEILAWK
jgi:quinol monooxygenase YgiN